MINSIQTIPYVPNNSSTNKRSWKNADLQEALRSEFILHEEKENIVEMLRKVEDTERDTGKPFFTIGKEWLTHENLKKSLSTIIWLFEWCDPIDENITKKIYKIIEWANREVRELEKVHFIWAPIHWGVDHLVNSVLWDKINKKNNINIRDMHGNGWYYERVKDLDDYEEVASVYVTEHLLSKKPNAVVVIISADLRPRYNMMNKYCNLDKNQIKNLRTMSDEEIKDRYYVEKESER